jgi:hypothetical protein
MLPSKSKFCTNANKARLYVNEIFEFGQDEYGHTEQKYQYLTTINNLTNEELLSILSWMMETIQNGYRD